MTRFYMNISYDEEARGWAKKFCKAISDNSDVVIDEDYMTGWFSSAMMATDDYLESWNIPKYY